MAVTNESDLTTSGLWLSMRSHYNKTSRGPQMNKHASVSLAALVTTVLAAGTAAGQQPPPIGIAPVVVKNAPYVLDTAEQHSIRVDVLARGLARPFSLAFLPNGDALITERGARLRLVRGAARAAEVAQLVAEPIAGLPAVAPARGGGLNEVALHPDFATNGLIYFTYNRPGKLPEGAAANAVPPMALVVARAKLEGMQLTGAKELLVGEERPGASGQRLAFGQNDMLFITTGAPDTKESQDLGNVYGKVLRIKTDGTVPADNPFVKRKGARPEVYAYGLRDQLGLTVQPGTGTVIAMDHGPNGGDEANIILPGRNYGWPLYSFGRTYEGPRVSEMPLAAGIEAPLLVWIPSIAPTGAVFYTGTQFPAWKNNLFIGSSRRGEVNRTGGIERVVFNDKMEEMRRETLLTDLHQRIRDVRQGPDGLLYAITDDADGMLLRIAPSP